MTENEWLLLILCLPILLGQGVFLFIHSKKSRNFPWFWGLWGLTTFPLPILLYLLFVIWPKKRNAKKER